MYLHQNYTNNLYYCQIKSIDFVKNLHMIKNLTKLSENIRLLRQQHGLTQEKLANLLNGKKSLVSNYENGYSTPDIETLIKLADIFNVSLDELVGRTFI